MKENKKFANQDLEDSANDKKKLKGDQATLDLPDVEDIPGQKNIKPIPAKAFADTTISSDDEEGKDVFDKNDETNVSLAERTLLDSAYDHMSTDDEPVDELALDDKDNDGEELNEKGLGKDLFGNDLDMPLIEEEDEEDDENQG